MIRVVLAQPRGFCAGVERAIEIVERALKKYGPPIYVRHEIVHNRHVVEDLRTRGAVFVDELDEIPPGAMTVFSAHGVAKRVEQLAAERGPAGDRRHLPAGRQGAQRGPPLRRARAARSCWSAMPAMPRWRARSARSPAKVHLVQTVADVATLRGRRPGQARLHHPDHAVGRRHARHHRGAEGAVSLHRRAGRARHLLRDAEPPAGGARPGQARWT